MLFSSYFYRESLRSTVLGEANLCNSYTFAVFIIIIISSSNDGGGLILLVVVLVVGSIGRPYILC